MTYVAVHTRVLPMGSNSCIYLPYLLFEKISNTTTGTGKRRIIMANHLPPTIDFAKAEEEICVKWAAEDTFKKQDMLSLERGDKVRVF